MTALTINEKDLSQSSLFQMTGSLFNPGRYKLVLHFKSLTARQGVRLLTLILLQANCMHTISPHHKKNSAPPLAVAVTSVSQLASYPTHDHLH
ncbi:hypothetical protein BaRGS_00004520 [Batillaria attramentaria]|uniref:Uncharacterized protein n=1 Tax=Batillaria attramentaria TaxID=370345 RepID=A0ABD0LYC8_9CAEN